MIQGASGQTPHSAEKDGDADAAKRALIPYGHTTLPVSLSVLVDANGCIRGVAKRKSTIIIPCTEESMGRTIKPVPHPLFDQLQYVDSGRSPEKTSMYLQQLAKWKGDDAKLEAVFKCVSEHSISEAAAHYGVELTDKDDKAGVCFEVQIGLEDSDLSNDVDINANPNGDPLNGNRPRTTSEGLGEVSDVALKRKIRNRLQDAGESVFVQSDDRSDDGAKSLSDRFNTYLKTLPKDEQKQKNVVFGKVCERWLDVRSFGQVFAFKKAKDTDEVSIGVRGPVSIQPAFSINPIAIDDVQITKSVNSETTDSGKKSSDTMGMKYRVSGRAVYVTYGSISPQLAERTGFSAEDAEKIKEALVTLFENDESSARPSGSMEVLDVVWFAHNCKGGQYSSAKVHRSVSVDADGTVNVDDASIPGLRYEVIEGR